MIAEIMTYRKVMYGMAYHILKNVDDADDVTQNAMIKAVTRISQFDETRAKLQTWCCAIVKFEALQLKTRSNMQMVEYVSNFHDSIEEDEETWMDDASMVKFMSEKVQHLVRTYPLIIRYDLADDFLLYYSGGRGYKNKRSKNFQSKLKSYQRMADDHNVNISIIKTTFKRTLDMLRLKLNKYIRTENN